MADSFIWGGQTRADLERRNQRLAELAAQGKDRWEIAEALDLTAPRISQIGRELGIEIPNRLREHERYDPVELFWSKVDMSGGPDSCWPWRAAPVGRQGKFTLPGRPQTRARRVAWELMNGPISPGMDVFVGCGLTSCCNPAHLYPAPHGTSWRYAAERGYR